MCPFYVLLCTSILIIISDCQIEDCYFTDQNSGEVLDLRPLNELTLNYYDGEMYTYNYTICANNLHCVPRFEQEDYVMIAQYEPDRQNPEECWWLAQWDNVDIKQPTYNPSTQVWSFPVTVGMPCPLTQQPRDTYLNWYCNETVETAEITSIQETDHCVYEVMVQSKYACSNTPPPFCNWYGGNPAVLLDLTAFENTVITSLDTNQNEYIFSYTPCRNGQGCNTLNAMGKLTNITTGDCMYLTIWDETNENNIAPNYDQTNEIWRFDYQNGETCGNGLDSIFEVYWYCNRTYRAPEYHIKNAQQVAPCLYEMGIESDVAC